MKGSVTFLVCFVVTMVASAVAARTNGIMVASHRADWQFAPENSLESLKNAIRFGADIIETDVRMTKDGHIVIMHDYAVDRTTNGSGYIGDLTLDDIRALRLRDNIGAMARDHHAICSRHDCRSYHRHRKAKKPEPPAKLFIITHFPVSCGITCSRIQARSSS